MQAARLLDWHDTGPHPEFDKVVRAVTHFLRPPSLTAEETLEAEAATLIRPPPNPASPEDDKPFGAVPQREEAATPSVSAQEQPDGHRHTTSNTLRQPGCLIAKSAVSCGWRSVTVCARHGIVSRAPGTDSRARNRNQGLVRPIREQPAHVTSDQ